MKLAFTFLLLISATYLFGQQTINLSADLVLTETLVISENTTYNGNGFAIRCDGCAPAIRVTNGATATFSDVLFPKSYGSWLFIEDGSRANWSSTRMTGFIESGPVTN